MTDEITVIIKDACLLSFEDAPKQYKGIKTLCGTVLKAYEGMPFLLRFHE